MGILRSVTTLPASFCVKPAIGPATAAFLVLTLAASWLGLGCSPPGKSKVSREFRNRAGEALEFARTHPGALDRFADGTHDWDDIEKGRIPVPETSPLAAEMLEFIDAAETYSEAILLARLAGQRISEPPPGVPASLSADSGDPDYQFAGRNVALPYSVQAALDQRRRERDQRLDRMTDEEFDLHARTVEEQFAAQSRYVHELLGWRVDPRDDLYIVDAGDGTIWRRKTPEQYVPIQMDRQPGSERIREGEKPEEDPPVDLTGADDGDLAGTGDPSASGGAQCCDEDGLCCGPDNRSLRSRNNGFSMGGAAWEPKGAIVDDGRTTQEVPVEVDCTGVKIRQRIVVTAGHCMFTNGSWNDNTKWIPGADGIDAELDSSDPSPNGYKNRWARVVRSNWFDHEWRNFDFGVFVLYDNSSSCSLHWHGWRRRGGLLNDTIYLYGYPGESRDCDASPLASNNCHGSIYGMSGSIKYVGSYRIRYTIDTQPGQSGTGFYEIDGGDRYVLGVHVANQSDTRNTGTYITIGNRNLINDAQADYPPNACN